MNRQYQRYLQTSEWKSTRAAAIRRADGKCQACGAQESLEVHHLTYERLYRERPGDLVVLCKTCHEAADQKRRREVASGRYQKAMETYAERKYGERWEEFVHMERLEEEFDAWLERKECSGNYTAD